MSGSVLDALSRRAAFVTDRKTSLAILGAAALTSVTVSPSREKETWQEEKQERRVRWRLICATREQVRRSATSVSGLRERKHLPSGH
jgi:hypothetical protein